MATAMLCRPPRRPIRSQIRAQHQHRHAAPAAAAVAVSASRHQPQRAARLRAVPPLHRHPPACLPGRRTALAMQRTLQMCCRSTRAQRSGKARREVWMRTWSRCDQGGARQRHRHAPPSAPRAQSTAAGDGSLESRKQAHTWEGWGKSVCVIYARREVGAKGTTEKAVVAGQRKTAYLRGPAQRHTVDGQGLHLVGRATAVNKLVEGRAFHELHSRNTLAQVRRKNDQELQQKSFRFSWAACMRRPVLQVRQPQTPGSRPAAPQGSLPTLPTPPRLRRRSLRTCMAFHVKLPQRCIAVTKRRAQPTQIAHKQRRAIHTSHTLAPACRRERGGCVGSPQNVTARTCVLPAGKPAGRSPCLHTAAVLSTASVAIRRRRKNVRSRRRQRDDTRAAAPRRDALAHVRRSAGAVLRQVQHDHLAAAAAAAAACCRRLRHEAQCCVKSGELEVGARANSNAVARGRARRKA
eukprot:362720-Chlamydomonas_euryale.AAC.2